MNQFYNARITAHQQCPKWKVQIKRKTYFPGLLYKGIQILLFTMLLYNGYAISQSPDWILLKEYEGIEVHYQITECSTEKFIYLKVNNKNTVEKKVIWMATLGNLNADVSLPSMTPITLQQGEELSSYCNTASPLLTLQLTEDFDISKFKFDLIVIQ